MRKVLRFLSSIQAGACLLALGAVCLARADTVTLDNGKTLEGHVIDNGPTITVEMAQGTVKLLKSRVKSITSKATPEDEYRRRSAEIQAALTAHELEPADAAERFYVLANWAGEQGLSRARIEALRRTLDLDPEHAGAREASGYVLKDGRWLTKAERNKELGFVLHNGQWVAPEALRDAKEAKDAARLKEREAERVAAEKQRKKDEEENKIEAERDLAERRDDARPPWWGSNRYNTGPWFWSGPINGWPPNLYVDPYSTYSYIPQTPGRANTVVPPASKTPGPFGPGLK